MHYGIVTPLAFLKQMSSSAVMVGALVIALTLAEPALAKAHVIGRYKTEVEGRGFKVITYDNNSVKVVFTGVFGPTINYNLREKMRTAVTSATGCNVADDFWLDGKLVGQLACPDDITPTTAD